MLLRQLHKNIVLSLRTQKCFLFEWYLRLRYQLWHHTLTCFKSIWVISWGNTGKNLHSRLESFCKASWTECHRNALLSDSSTLRSWKHLVPHRASQVTLRQRWIVGLVELEDVTHRLQHLTSSRTTGQQEKEPAKYWSVIKFVLDNTVMLNLPSLSFK